MKKKIANLPRIAMCLALALLLAFSALAMAACGSSEEADYAYTAEDLSGLNSNDLETAAEYSAFWIPEDGRAGDIMPYYEDGVYHIFYLKDGGGSSAHPVYRVTTTDFVHYEDKGLAIDAGASNSQEAMIGTGSVVKTAAGDYLFFYTGHPASGAEVVLVAKSEGNLDNFVKQTDFSISPGEYGFGNDFRDPEVVWDEASERYICIVATRLNGTAVLARFSFDAELENLTYDGILYTDTRGFNVLECPDLFYLDGRWYLTYSAQDLSLSGETDSTSNAMLAPADSKGCMYYLVADSIDGAWREVSDPQLDGNVFYAGKVAIGDEAMLVGWAAQKTVNAGYDYEWGGNIVAHVLTANEDGSLNLTYPKAYASYFDVEQPLLLEGEDGAETDSLSLIGSGGSYTAVAEERPEARLSMNVTFTSDTEEFGFVFGLESDLENVVKVTVNPSAGKVKVQYGENGEMTSRHLALEADTEYRVDVFSEGSCYVIYVGGASLTFRARNTGNKRVAVFAESGIVQFTDISYFAPSDADLDYTGTFALSAGEERVFTVSPETDAYMSAAADLYASGEIEVEIAGEGGTVAGDTGSGALQLYGYADTEAGESFTVRVTAKEDTTVTARIDGSQTYYVPTRESSVTRTGTDAGARITAEEDGVLSFSAVAHAEGGDARLVLTLNGEEIAGNVLAEENGLLFGSVEVSAGDVLAASVSYAGAPAAYSVSCTVWEGRAPQSNLYPADVCERTYSYDLGVEIAEDRTDSVSVATSFGEQGTDGFVYTYGKEIDEMQPIGTFNTNYENAYDYRYIEPSVTSDIEVKADWLKTGSHYYAGVTYIVAEDGELQVTLTLTPTEASEYVMLQLYHNRTRLAEDILVEGSGTQTYTVTVDAAAGDSIIFGIKNVGYMTDVGTAAANYTFSVGAAGSSDFSDYTQIANFAEDFSLTAQENGWTYGYVSDYFGGEGSDILDYTPFTQVIGDAGDAWGDPSIASIEIKAGWLLTENESVDAAIGYTVSESGTYAAELVFTGTNAEETRVTARLVVADADGNVRSATFISNGQASSSWSYANFNVSAQAGDTVYVVFFREGGLGYYQGSVTYNLYR